MVEGVEYVQEQGIIRDHQVDIYSLSTCGFCTKAMKFLLKKGVQFRYVNIDTLPRDKKDELKKKLRERYGTKGIFPTLILDEAEALNGFNRELWEQRLGLA